ncbi:Arylsulfatase [Diplonema papillatum]|nr:Arylsulfatase [Diplonema papillatum]
MMSALFVVVSMALVVGTEGHWYSNQKHIIFAICDDCGWADVGYHGSNFPTPNIDELARNGIRLDRFYTQAMCTPSRSATMTGRYPFNTGTQRVFQSGTTDHLPLEYKTMGQVMSDEGYSTHYIGKWHLGYASYSYFPTNRGFDSFVGYMQGRNGFYAHDAGRGRNTGLDFWNNTELYPEADGVYSNTVFLQELNRVVENAVELRKPSFVVFSPASVHVKLEYPPANYSACDGVSPVGRNKLCNMIGNFDETVGEVVETYKRAGIWDDTLMIFFSDNGGATSAATRGSFSSNYPLRAGKVSFFEGGVRTLGFVQGGERVLPHYARGSIKSNLMHVVDLLPTVFGAARLRSSNLPAGIDGVNQWWTIISPIDMTGPRSEIPINIQRGGNNRTAIIVGEWKLLVGGAANDGHWTISPYVKLDPPRHGAIDGNNTFLFNIYDDPTEQFNVAGIYPSIVADLRSRIASYVNTTSYKEPTKYAPDDFAPGSLPSDNGGAWVPFLD